jgi:hypothetical protein
MKNTTEGGEIHIAMEKTTYYYYEDGEKDFDALDFFIHFSGSRSDGDGEHEIIDRIKKEFKCEDLIYTEIENKDGGYDLVRIIDLPEIYDYETIGDGGHHGPFSNDNELIDYVKKLKTIPFNEI